MKQIIGARSHKHDKRKIDHMCPSLGDFTCSSLYVQVSTYPNFRNGPGPCQQAHDTTSLPQTGDGAYQINDR